MLRKIKKWFTIDNCVDFAVDILLIIWEVISSPVLIVMRLARHFVGEWVTGKIKAFIRWIAHWFERKRAYRLKHGIGLFRTYWWLILSSPIILIVSIIAIAILTGLTEGLNLVYNDISASFE